MQKLLVSLVFIFNLVILNAQEDTIINTHKAGKSDIFIEVDQKPKFPGGKEGLINFYKETSLFSICEKKEVNCKTLYYQLIIDTIGNVGDFKIIRGINRELDTETERIISQMPKWSVGIKNGHKVKVLVTLDIKYKLKE
jgi:hypothetical protein